MTQLPLTADRARILLDNEVRIDYQQLVQLLIQEIFYKQLCCYFYAKTKHEEVHKNPPTFKDILWDMKDTHLAFLVE